MGVFHLEFVEPIRDKRKIEAMKKVLRGTNMRDYLTADCA